MSAFSQHETPDAARTSKRLALRTRFQTYEHGLAPEAEPLQNSYQEKARYEWRRDKSSW